MTFIPQLLAGLPQPLINNFSHILIDLSKTYIFCIVAAAQLVHLYRISCNLGWFTYGAFHQRRSSLNQVQVWPWPRFSRNFCCTNALQIKSRVKLGLTLNRRGRRIKRWSSVQLALSSGPRTVIPDISVQIAVKLQTSAYYIHFQVIHQWITTLINKNTLMHDCGSLKGLETSLKPQSWIKIYILL